MVLTRRALAEGRNNPSRIIDGCNRMLSKLERRLEGRGSVLARVDLGG